MRSQTCFIYPYPKMRFTIATVVVPGATLAQAFQWDLYSNNNGQDFIASFSGEVTGPNGPTSYEHTGHLGSINFVSYDQYPSQLNMNNGCIGTTIPCCQYAPGCRDGAGTLTGSGCLTIDQDVTEIAAVSLVCDSLCIDNGYKKRRAARTLAELEG
jgi:hypothetical protein